MTDPAASRMTTPMTTSSASRIDFNTPALQRKRRLRALKDRLTNWYVLIGGVAVLATITLIFFYLAYVVLPLFRGAEMTALEPQSPAWVQAADRPLFMAIEEQNEIALRVSAQGEAVQMLPPTVGTLRICTLPSVDAACTKAGSTRPTPA